MTVLLNVCCLLLLIIGYHAENAPDWNPFQIHYPPARRDNSSSSFRSAKLNETVIVPDPYRWMGNVRSNETQSFLQAEEDLLQSYLKHCQFALEQERIKEMYQYRDLTAPYIGGSIENPIFAFSVNEGNTNRPVWYLANASEVDEAIKTNFATMPGKKYFDENLLNSESSASLTFLNVSPDGQLVVYKVNEGGGNHSTVYVRRTDSPFIDPEQQGKVPGGAGRLNDKVVGAINVTPVWMNDSKSFIYAHDPAEFSLEKSLPGQLKYHKVGTEQEEDIVLISAKEGDSISYWYFEISPDYQWILANLLSTVDAHGYFFIAPLDQPISDQMNWITVESEPEFLLSYIINDQEEFFFITDKDNAMNLKVVKCIIDKSKAKPIRNIGDTNDSINFLDWFPERPDAYLESYQPFDGTKMIVTFVEQDKDQFYLYDLKTGKILQKLFPNETVSYHDIEAQSLGLDVYLSTNTFNKPDTLYRIRLNEDKTQVNTIIAAEATVPGVDLNDFVTSQRWATSKDGTQVPFFYVKKKDLELNGTQCAWINFYGSYGAPYLARYTPHYISWINHHNCIFVLAAPRGGGELGSAYSLEGKGRKRQNEFDDLISVAEHLVEYGMAGKGLIILEGGSAAGTAAMAVANQAPEGLFGAIVADRGMFDMVNYLSYYSGLANIVEFGNPNDPEDFDVLNAYSPLQNVNSSKIYPTIVITSSENDIRIQPGSSFKMIAELQHDLPENPNPLLLANIKDTGHLNAQGNNAEKILRAAIEQSIIAHTLGLDRES